MTRIVNEGNQVLYQCEECEFFYLDKDWSEKCEAWCKEHHTCNIEITKHAIQQNG